MIFDRADVEGVAVLTMATPDSHVNVVDVTLFRELSEQFDAITKDDGVEAIVLISAKVDNFGVGADLDWVDELSRSRRGPNLVEEIHTLMARLYWSRKPLVAAIDGSALGGALELGLACRSIIATPSSTFGLPEVRLGLMPGGGGTVLLPRCVDPPAAVEMLTTGRHVTSARAHELGLVAEIVGSDELVTIAVTTTQEITGLPRDPWTHETDIAEAVDRYGPGGEDAIGRIVDSIRFSADHDLEDALTEERRFFFEQIRTPQARSGIHQFRAERALKRRAGPPREAVAALGVIGAGQMGAGIAATAALNGIHVVVRDVDEQTVERAHDVFKATIDRHGASAVRSVGSWTGGLAWDSHEELNAVIEAVYESETLKSEVLTEVCSSLRTDALIATNTSSLSIAKLATAVDCPDRFLGMHFFSPVDRMRLVELIPHSGTSEEAVRRATDLGRQMRKVPVVVSDSPGFFTSRVYARWLVEGIRLLMEGSSPDAIDRAAGEAGFAAGPMVAIDEASVDLVLAASIGQVASKIMSTRIDVGQVTTGLTTLRSSGLTGRRKGRGFYVYDESGMRTGPNPAIHDVLGIPPRGPREDEMMDRLVLAFVSESLLTWDEGVLCHPDDGDFASVAGIGFPRGLGGPFHYSDQLGPRTLLDQLSRLGPAFPAGITLNELARTESSFSSFKRTSLPPLTSPNR